MKNVPNGPGFWKFSGLFMNNETFKINVRDFIRNTKSKLNLNESNFNWKLLKYDIDKVITSYSKAITKEGKATQLKLENTLKILENNLTHN